MNEVHFECRVLSEEISELQVVLWAGNGMRQQAGAPALAVMEVYGMQRKIITQRGLRHAEFGGSVAFGVVAPGQINLVSLVRIGARGTWIQELHSHPRSEPQSFAQETANIANATAAMRQPLVVFLDSNI